MMRERRLLFAVWVQGLDFQLHSPRHNHKALSGEALPYFCAQPQHPGRVHGRGIGSELPTMLPVCEEPKQPGPWNHICINQASMMRGADASLSLSVCVPAHPYELLRVLLVSLSQARMFHTTRVSICVRQGCTANSVLFTVALDPVVRWL